MNMHSSYLQMQSMCSLPEAILCAKVKMSIFSYIVFFFFKKNHWVSTLLHTWVLDLNGFTCLRIMVIKAPALVHNGLGLKFLPCSLIYYFAFLIKTSGFLSKAFWFLLLLLPSDKISLPPFLFSQVSTVLWVCKNHIQ